MGYWLNGVYEKPEILQKICRVKVWVNHFPVVAPVLCIAQGKQLQYPSQERPHLENAEVTTTTTPVRDIQWPKWFVAMRVELIYSAAQRRNFGISMRMRTELSKAIYFQGHLICLTGVTTTTKY